MGKRPSNEPPVRLADSAWEVLRAALDKAFSATDEITAVIENTFLSIIPAEQRTHALAVLEGDTTPTKAYRVGLMVQLAYAVAANQHIDITHRQPGARGRTGVAGQCGRYLLDRHVKASIDAYQNIAKNSTNLVRGNNQAFDAFLRWAAEPSRTRDEYKAALYFACLRIARTARPVKAMPQLEKGKLTFAAVMKLLSALLATPSRGVYQQFIVAALLTARVDQEETGQRVETKSVTASDESSGTAADVQVKTGTRVDEAYEVTANDWDTKLDEAGAKIRGHDLARLHIVARVADVPAMIAKLEHQGFDISALDLTAFVSVLVADLRKEFRAVALRRLYELLERRQSDTDLVNGYVEQIIKHNLSD